MQYYIKPWSHQLDAIESAKHTNELFLAWEMGTGKTATAINILRHKYRDRQRFMRTLILAPIATLRNWERELYSHAQLGHNALLVLDESNKRKKLMETELFSNGSLHPGKIVLLNYEAVINKDIHKMLMLWQPEILILDESHYCKSPKSKRSKAVLDLSDRAEYKYLLSGTPILDKTGMDLFQQYLIMDNGRTFGRNFFTFRNAYYVDKNERMRGTQKYFPDFRPRPGAFGDIALKISPSMIRKTKQECLDLPPLIRVPYYVEMKGEQKRVYKEMRDDYLAFIKTESDSGLPETALATVAITKALRLQQIVSGHVPTDAKRVHDFGVIPRLEALQDLLSELTPQHKVIVWACFKHNYEAIAAVCESLKINYAMLHGGIRGKKKDENIELFRGDPDCRVMIANQAAGGIGINLTEASYSIYYSRDFSLEHDLQSEARNHRAGSEVHDKITRIDLICRDTIDELVFKCLAEKQSVSDKILTWTKYLGGKS